MLLDRAPHGWHIPERQRSDLQLPRRRFDEDTDSFAVSLPSAGGAPGTFRPLSDSASGAAAAQLSSERPAGLHQPPRQSAADAGPPPPFRPQLPGRTGRGGATAAAGGGARKHPGGVGGGGGGAPGGGSPLLPPRPRGRARQRHVRRCYRRMDWGAAGAAGKAQADPARHLLHRYPYAVLTRGSASHAKCRSGLQQISQQQPFIAGLSRLVISVAFFPALVLGITQNDCCSREYDAGWLWRQRSCGAVCVGAGRGGWRCGRVKGECAGGAGRRLRRV